MKKDNSSSTFHFPLRRFLYEYLNLNKDKGDETEIINSIHRGIEFKGTNLWVLIFAIFIASLGLNVNSPAVIIGAMLISPLMGPIMGIGLAIGINDIELLKRSFKSYLITTAFSVVTATIYFFFTPLAEAQSELLARTSPSIYDVFIALLGGLAGILAVCSKERGNVIPGVAIATALMPPLCTAGFGIATGNFVYFLGAFYLYFINSVFISVATFLGVRVMKFSPKEFLDKEREIRVRKYIILIVILTMSPAIYLTIDIVKNALYESAANNFIAKELNFNNTQILDRKINYDKRQIRIVLLGEEVPEASIQLARKKIDEYNKLKNTELTILQGVNNEEVDLSSIRALVLEDFYKNSEERLHEQQQKINRLENDLRIYQHYNEITEQLIPELKVLYPSTRSLSLSHTVEVDVESLKTDTFTIAVMRFNHTLAHKEKEKISDWLKARLGTENLKMIIQ